MGRDVAGRRPAHGWFDASHSKIRSARHAQGIQNQAPCRALEHRLSEVNSLTYKPRPIATFREFAAKWQKDVLTQFKPSTGPADRSRIKMHLLPQFGDLCMKNVTAQHIQAMIAGKQRKLSAKSIRNLVATLRMMWTQARAWGYTQHDPFFGLVLPDRGLLNERFLSRSMR